jgi:hypothetical protein
MTFKVHDSSEFPGDIYRDIVRIPEEHRLDARGKKVAEGTVCKLTINGKSKRAFVRGCKDEKGAIIVMDYRTRKAFGVTNKSAVEVQIASCHWLGECLWACRASDPAYKIPAQLGVSSLFLGIVGLFLGILSIVRK